MKLSILSSSPRGEVLGLIDDLWIGARCAFRKIVALIDERGATVFQSITIGSIRPDGHQNDRVISPQPEVHALLKASTFSPAHLDIGDDVIAHGHSC